MAVKPQDRLPAALAERHLGAGQRVMVRAQAGPVSQAPMPTNAAGAECSGELAVSSASRIQAVKRFQYPS